MNPPPYTPQDLTALREQILARCNDQELRTLCADLGVDYDDLPVMGRANKARELVAFLERRNRLPELPPLLARPRPAKIRPAQLRNRQAMLQLVHNFWVKGVLEQSLHGAVIIALGLQERAGAVERPWDMVLQAPEKPDRNLPPGTKIIDVFDEMSCALLILGEPGSGKTTMLLKLARDTIARAEQDPTRPIPVVFNLSSWAEKRQPLVEWLIVELNIKYNIPKKIARPWVEKDELLLLLDGLDEVKLECQAACVQAINEFRQEHGLAPLVVCSRSADYAALTTRLKLQGAVLLQPLTPEQIDRYLAGMGDELAAVHGALQHDPALQELAQSPLMLSIMTLAYRGASARDLATGTAEARRKHLFEAYLRQMFKRRSAKHAYSPEQTTRWLAYLAQQMIQRAQTVFLIERMQPDWQTVPRRQFAVITRLIVGLGGGLIFGLGGGLIFGLSVGLIVGLMGGLIVGLRNVGSIEPTEKLEWLWERARTGLIFGLIGGLIVGLIFGLIFGLIVGLGLGLIFGLSVGLIFGLRPTKIEMTTYPNQGIWNSAKNAMMIMLIVGLMGGLSGGLICGLMGGLISGLKGGLIVGLMGGLSGGLSYGGAAVIQHYTLRFFLSRAGCLPWNLVRFLDYCSERIFLRKVGGGYIFVHRTLMEYFASLNQSQVKP
jgi:hypothetical protein